MNWGDFGVTRIYTAYQSWGEAGSLGARRVGVYFLSTSGKNVFVIEIPFNK